MTTIHKLMLATSLATALLLTAACGNGDAGNTSTAAVAPVRPPMPLDPDPPMSAAYIDDIVDEARGRSAPPTPSPRDALRPVDGNESGPQEGNEQ